MKLDTDRIAEVVELVSTQEIADLLGVRRSTVHMWRQRDLDFPEPDWHLSIGPVWMWHRVEDWAIRTGRLSEV